MRPLYAKRRELLAAALRELGSLYGAPYDELEAEGIRSTLRRMGVPIDPVLAANDIGALDDTYWEPSGSDRYEARLRRLRIETDVRRVHHPRRWKRQP